MAKLYHDERSGTLRAAFDHEVLDWPEVTSRKMFGCPAYRVNGTLFAFLTDEGVVLTQLTPEDQETLVAQFDATPFQAGPQTIKRWLLLPATEPDQLEPLFPAVHKAYGIAQRSSESG